MDDYPFVTIAVIAGLGLLTLWILNEEFGEVRIRGTMLFLSVLSVFFFGTLVIILFNEWDREPMSDCRSHANGSTVSPLHQCPERPLPQLGWLTLHWRVLILAITLMLSSHLVPLVLRYVRESLLKFPPATFRRYLLEYSMGYVWLLGVIASLILKFQYLITLLLLFLAVLSLVIATVIMLEKLFGPVPNPKLKNNTLALTATCLALAGFVSYSVFAGLVIFSIGFVLSD
jgi:magnesium-transporting ATPase (P-type)